MHPKDLENGRRVFICDGCLNSSKPISYEPSAPTSAKDCEFFEAGGNLWVRWEDTNTAYTEKVGRSVDEIIDWWRNLIAKDFGVRNQQEYDALIDRLFKDGTMS